MIKFSLLDIQFLACLISNPDSLSTLEKEISPLDFDNVIYYDIYVGIVDHIIKYSAPNITDLKIKFNDDSIVLSVIDEIIKQNEIVTELTVVYEELCEASRKKRLKKLSKDIKEGVTRGNSKDTIQRTELELSKINLTTSSSIVSIAQMETKFMKDLNERVEKFSKHSRLQDAIELSTGYETLDALTLGFQRGETVIIGGATGSGKTQLVIQHIDALMKNSKMVLYFLLEDNKFNIVRRIISLRTKIPINKLRVGNINSTENDSVQKCWRTIKASDLLLIEEDLMDINDIVSKTNFLKLKYPNISAVILDNINIGVDRLNKNGNREQELSGISKKLLMTAKKCDVAMIILQQVNTSPDARKTGVPMNNNDLRDSKATSHDASLVMLLHYPDANTQDKDFSKKRMQLYVTKNRNGESGKMIEYENKAHISKFIERTESIR